MVIKLSPDWEAVLHELARRQGVTPDDLANSVLRERLLLQAQSDVRPDDWERVVLALATDCEVSLSHSAVSSDGLYE